MIRRSRKRK